MRIKNKLFFYCRAFWIGFLIATVYWFLEAFIHSFVFHSGAFTSQLIPENSNEVWMRVFTATLFIFSTLILAYFIRERFDLMAELHLSNQALHVLREGCVITDNHNEIVYVNPRYEEISGYKLSEIKGKNPNILSSGKQDKSFYQDLWSALLKEGFWEGELWNRNRSGKLYIQWINISIIKNPNGKIAYYVGIFKDITSQKKMEEKIKYYRRFKYEVQHKVK